MVEKSGSSEKFFKELAAALRAGSHPDSRFVRKFSTFTVEEVEVNGNYGRTVTKVVEDAAAGIEWTEEVEWVKVGNNWFLKSEYDEE